MARRIPSHWIPSHWLPAERSVWAACGAALFTSGLAVFTTTSADGSTLALVTGTLNVTLGVLAWGAYAADFTRGGDRRDADASCPD